MDKTSVFDSIVCGHHVYKTVWTPFLGEILEAGEVVGHVLCKLSQMVWPLCY